jgi:large subunit ribosomal protein L24
MLDQLNGQILLNAAHLAVMPRVDVRDFKGVVRFGEGRIALEVMQGTLAGGRMSGELVFLQDGEGLIARTHVHLMDANASDLLPGDGVISGRLKLDLAAEGTGMSALALVGSLEGSGTFTLENARVARLDPRAFEILVRAVDQGLPIDPNQLRDRLDIALASGALSIPRAEGTITITGGQARLSNSMAGARGSELAVIGTVNLVDGNVDARLTLSSAAAADAVRKVPPEISLVLKGPLGAPKRSIEVGSFANWLAVRALEQASTKLDVLEGREQGSQPANEPEQPPTDKKPRPADAGASRSAVEAARPRANPRNMHPPKPSATELTPPAPPPRAPPIIPQWLFGVQ